MADTGSSEAPEGTLPRLRPEELTVEQRAVYDRIAGGPRAAGVQHFPLTDEEGALTGPFNALLYSPPIGAAMSAVGEAVRYASDLGDRQRELAILCVAAHHRSAFEWYAHTRIARHLGITQEELVAIRDGTELPDQDETEQLVVTVCRALLAERGLPAALRSSATATLGHAVLVELVLLVGYYESLALLLGAFDVPAPEPITWTEHSTPPTSSQD